MTVKHNPVRTIPVSNVADEPARSSGPTVQAEASNAPTAVIASVQEDIVRLRLTDPDKHVLTKNEVVYVRPNRQPNERLKAEVLRVIGHEADAQVYESTSGVSLNDRVEQTGQLLSIKLGPGLLGQVFDGLQNPLEVLA
jgi:V/A-type H+-transporting ATPase subunit A